ncbi:MAG: hypothetical protein AUI15_36635 [Actinobacteria bacterium 13_2_20CM_2_66_6]|nr:MAG: hypothetical protein AUI15_36635 [Actinobacteria bacterium 13_2_20CM_2_66_6]
MAEHTKGLRLQVCQDRQSSARPVFKVGVGTDDLLLTIYRGKQGYRQAELDADYLNTLIEQDEARQASFQRLQSTGEDLLVNVGNMSGASLDQCPVNAEYEAMVQDYLDTFNHAVSQGVAPIRAVYAFCQGFAITLGCCLRADLPFEVARQLVAMVMKTATASEKMVRQITTSMSKQ